MNLIPIIRYRPTRANDGAGGFLDTFDAGVNLYGAMALHDKQEALDIDLQEDVHVADVIAVAAEEESDGQIAYYRAVLDIRQPRARRRLVTLERIAKPIFPAYPRYVLFGGQRVFFNGGYLTWN